MMLLGVGIVGTLTSAVVVAYASARPAIVGTPGEVTAPGAWVTPLWVVLVLFVVLLVVAQHRLVPWTARVAVGGGLVALAGIGLLVASRTVPTPGIGVGVGTRLPLTVAGCAIAVLAGLLYLAGVLLVREATGPLAWLPAVVTVVGTVLLLVATTLVGVRAAGMWTDAANTAQSVASADLGSQRPTSFTGGVRWTRDQAQWADTEGGLVGQAGPGIVAVDPTTGQPRWRYERWGMSFFGRPVASADGRLVAVAGTNEGVVRRYRNGGAASSQIFVFDSRRGELVTKFEAAGDRPLAVGDGIVLTGQPAGHYLAEVTAYRLDGVRSWRYRGHRGCALTGVLLAADGVVASCGRVSGTVTTKEWVGAVVKLGLETGERRWRWLIKGHVPAANGLVYHSGTLFVAAPHTAEYSRQLVAAVDAGTGQVRWQHHRVMIGDHQPQQTYSYTALYTRNGFTVAGTAHAPLGGGERVDLTSFDATDGRLRWRHEETFTAALADYQELPTLDRPGLGQSVAAAGRSIVLLGTGQPQLTGNSGGSPLVVRTVDAATGRAIDSVTLSPKRLPYRKHGAVHAVDGAVAVTAEVAGEDPPSVSIGLN